MKKIPFLICYFSLIIIMTGYSLIIPFTENFVTQYNISSSHIGFVISVYALGQFIFSPLIGDLLEHVPQKKVLKYGLLLYAFSTIFVYINNSYIMLLIFRFLSGIAAAAVFPAAESYVTLAVKEKNKFNVTQYSLILSTANGIGMAIGPLIGILLLSTNTVTTFIFFYVLLILIVMALTLFLDNNIIEKTKTTISSPITYVKDQINIIISLYKTKKIRYMMNGFLVFGIITSALEAYGLPYLKTFFDLSKDIPIGLSFIILLIAAFYFLVLSPKVEKKFKYIPQLSTYTLIGGLSLIFIILYPKNINIFVIFFALSALTTAVFSSVMVAYITNETEEPKRILSNKNSLICLGMVIGPIIGGQLYSFNATFMIIFIATGLIGISIYGFKTYITSKNKR